MKRSLDCFLRTTLTPKPLRGAAFLIGTVSLLGALAGCGARRTDATDTKTNWLSQCVEDPDCGGELSCLCGVCTTACDGPRDCRTLDGKAQCIEVPACGAAAAVCALSRRDLDIGETDAATETSGPASESMTSSTSATNTSGAITSEPITSGSDDVTSEGASTDQTTLSECTEDTNCALAQLQCEPGERPVSDGCSCSCQPDAACDPDVEYVEYGAACDVLLDFACDAGEVTVFDDCGCGCKPADETDGGAPEQCPAPPDGAAVDVTILAAGSCFGDLWSQVITSQEELDTALASCGLPEVTADFTNNVVYLGVFSDRLSTSFDYAVDVGGTIRVQLASDAYCGGAAPPDAFVLLQLNDVGANTPVEQEWCTLGRCSGLPVP